MKRSMKLLTMLLTVVLLLQIAPAGAVGGTADAYAPVSDFVYDTGLQAEPADVVPDVQSDETAAPAIDETPAEPAIDETPAEPAIDETPAEPAIDETPAEPAIDETPAEPAIDETPAGPMADEIAAPLDASSVIVYRLYWQADIGSDEFFRLTEITNVDANHIRIRILCTGTPTSISAYIDEQPVAVVPNGNKPYMDLELVNGYHSVRIVVSDGVGESVYNNQFFITGSDDYPKVNYAAPDSVDMGEAANVFIKGYNLTDVETVSMTVKINPALKVSDIVFAPGMEGMYYWCLDELYLILELTDISRLPDEILATIKVEVTSEGAATEDMDWTMVTSLIKIAEGSSIGSSENFVPTVTEENLYDFVNTGYNISRILSSVDDTIIFTITNQNHHPAPGVHLYDADTDQLIATASQNGIVITDYFARGGTCRVYCRDDNGLVSDVYEFTT